MQMLPLLLFESAWKVIWLAVVALPLWTFHQMDAAAQELASQCLLVVVILVVIPWRHVYVHYALSHGDRWR